MERGLLRLLMRAQASGSLMQVQWFNLNRFRLSYPVRGRQFLIVVMLVTERSGIVNAGVRANFSYRYSCELCCVKIMLYQEVDMSCVG